MQVKGKETGREKGGGDGDQQLVYQIQVEPSVVNDYIFSFQFSFECYCSFLAGYRNVTYHCTQDSK